MSHLHDLIHRLCPNGIPLLRMAEILRIKNGKTYKHLSDGNVPVYGSGGIMTYVSEASHSGPSVLIPRKGSLRNVYYVDEPFWNVDTIFATEINRELVHPRYLYHFLLNSHLDELNQAGGVPSLTQSTLNALPIPVPPLPVQEEIVRILDSLTKLEAELEAELEARRQQYDWYRNRAFSSLQLSNDVVRLGDLGLIARGRRFTKADQVAEGIPAIHYGEIYTRYGTATDSVFTYLRSDLVNSLRFAQPNDVVIVGVGEDVEEVGQAVAWLGDGPVAIHDDSFSFTSDLNPEYVSHFMRSSLYRDQKREYVSRGKMKRLSAKSIGSVVIPVPPKDVQQRVVDVLNNFADLTSDLSSGLPAEIAARRQQYEYYRDRLLSFEELPE